MRLAGPDVDLTPSAAVALIVPEHTEVGGTGECEAETPDLVVMPVRAQRLKIGRKPKRLPAPAMRRFAYIRGVSDGMAEAMRSAGVKSLGDIANWSRADVKWFQAILGEEARISRDQWIEQAQLLADGVWTRYALRVVGGETRQLVEKPAVMVAAPEVVVPEVVSSDVAQPMAQPPVAETVAEISRRPTPVVAPIAAPADSAPVETRSQEFKTQKIVVADVGAASTERFDPMLSLTTKIALGKLRRPPPDLGRKRKSAEHSGPNRDGAPSAEQSPRTTNEATNLAKEDTAPVDAVDSAEDSATLRGRSPSDTRQDELPAVDETADATKRASDEVGGELSEQELADLVTADDWDAADALIVRRVDGQSAVSPDLSRRAGDQVSTTLSNAAGNTIAAGEIPAPTVAETADSSVDDADYGWCDEAEVTIVSRDRSKLVEGSEASKSGTPTGEPTGQSGPVVRDRTGQSPELVARRLQSVRDTEDDFDADHVGYHDSVEEATVTIIRAEASETDAGGVVRTDIANDVGEADEPKPVHAVRKIGSKFLKALTGD